MSRKKGEGSHSGETYSPSVCNVIFFLLIRGIRMSQLTNIFGRSSEEAINLCWKRICLNATDYPNKRDLKRFKLTPIIDVPWPCLNFYAKQFVMMQTHKVEKKSSPERISKQTGIPIEKIEKFLEGQKMLPQHERVSLL